jgi:hypothetical protein
MTDQTEAATYQKLLSAKDTLIDQLNEQVMLLGELEEGHRLHQLAICEELATHRDLHRFIAKGPWSFFVWLCLHDVWPFSVWYGRHE